MSRPRLDIRGDLKCRVEQYRLGSHDSRKVTLDGIARYNPEVVTLNHGGESSLTYLDGELSRMLPKARILRFDEHPAVEVEA